MSGWEIRLATPDDFGAVMELQSKPMQGPIRISLAMPPQPDDRIIIAFRRGRLMGMGKRSRARHYWDGVQHWVGVLGGLRSNCELLPRHTVMEMYRQLRMTRAADEPDWDLTAILEDNGAARRLLEAGLRGMPRYTLLTRALTFTFRAAPSSSDPPSHPRPPEASPTAMSDLATQPGDAREVAVAGARCRVERMPGRRTLVAGYAPGLSLTRPALNAWLRLGGKPWLPKPGAELREAFVSDARWERGDYRALSALIPEVRRVAAEAGADLVHWGLPSNHGDAAWLRSKLRVWETHSRVYAVHDPESPAPAWEDFRPEISRL